MSDYWLTCTSSVGEIHEPAKVKNNRMPNSLKKKKPRINFEPKYSNEDQPRFKKTQSRRNSEYSLKIKTK